MKMRKTVLLVAVLALLSAGARAGVPMVTVLYTNGAKLSLAFDLQPSISSDNFNIWVCGSTLNDCSEWVSYGLQDVDRLYFEMDGEVGLTQVKGAGSEQHPTVSYAQGVLTAEGMAAGERLKVISAGGSTVGTATADGSGTARVDLVGCSAGTYVVSTGSGVSFKLLKK